MEPQAFFIGHYIFIVNHKINCVCEFCLNDDGNLYEENYNEIIYINCETVEECMKFITTKIYMDTMDVM